MLGGGMLQDRPPVRVEIPKHVREEFERDSQLKSDQWRQKHPYLGGLEDFATSFLGINPDEGQTVFEPPKSNQRPMRLGSALGEAAGFANIASLPSRLKNLGKAALTKAPALASESGHGIRSVMQPGAMNEFAAVDDPATISKFYRGTPSKRVELPQYGFKTGGMSTIDPKAAKEISRLYVEMLDKNNPFEAQFRESLDAVRQRFPRALGNVDSISLQHHPDFKPVTTLGTQNPVSRFNPSFDDDGADAFNKVGNQLIDRRSNLFFDPKSIEVASLADISSGNPDAISKYLAGAPLDMRPRMVNTITHELTHAGQQQRKGLALNKAYREANNSVGYGANPFEISARRQGERASQDFSRGGRLSGRRTNSKDRDDIALMQLIQQLHGQVR